MASTKRRAQENKEPMRRRQRIEVNDGNIDLQREGTGA
jgi:hypothetical protein